MSNTIVKVLKNLIQKNIQSDKTVVVNKSLIISYKEKNIIKKTINKLSF